MAIRCKTRMQRKIRFDIFSCASDVADEDPPYLDAFTTSSPISPSSTWNHLSRMANTIGAPSHGQLAMLSNVPAPTSPQEFDIDAFPIC